jgi:uncharacterized tellurite resistance protein B-like protein
MSIDPAALPDVATLYVAVGARESGMVGESERHEIAIALSELFSQAEEGMIRDALGASIASSPRTPESRTHLIRHLAVALKGGLDAETIGRIMTDLSRIAGSDGIVTGDEKETLAMVADTWNFEIPSIAQPLADIRVASIGWTCAHDLALVYLGLAHGADDELSRSEVNAMVRTLQRWQPELTADESAGVLRDAMERYAAGPRAHLVDRAVTALRESLSLEERRMALSDLIRIANADGVFLDNEEDLIVRLQDEWEVDPDALYD